jgi:ferredoxin-type protein NapG
MDPAVSRRQLLRGRFFGRIAQAASARVEEKLEAVQAATKAFTEAKPAPQGPKQNGRQDARVVLPILRPPGAIDEASFLATCTKCDECVKACPYQAIIHAPSRFRQAEGTPMIHPTASPCHMCPDTPCITACEPGALRKERPLKMGTAVVQGFNCLAHRNSFCTVCSEQCPVEGAVKVVNGRPVIDEKTCTGCGVCHYACPAPQNAIIILPLRDRPAVSSEAL